MAEIFLALAMTLSLEMPFFLLSSRKSLSFFLSFVLVNFFSNLTMNLLYVFLFNRSFSFLVVAEILVFFLEGSLYSLFLRKSSSFLLSFLANFFSLTLGFFLGPLLSGNVLAFPLLAFSLLALVEFLLLLVFVLRHSEKGG